MNNQNVFNGSIVIVQPIFLNCQNVEDEIAEGISLIEELWIYADSFERTEIPVSKLRIGLKCGGSDGYSGIAIFRDGVTL